MRERFTLFDTSGCKKVICEHPIERKLFKVLILLVKLVQGILILSIAHAYIQAGLFIEVLMFWCSLILDALLLLEASMPGTLNHYSFSASSFTGYV